MTGGFDAMLPVIDQMVAQYGLDAEAKKELTNIYQTWFKEDINTNAMIEQVGELYAEAFTAEEIQDMIDFYSTPTGQKMLDKTPELTQKAALIGMEVGQKAQPKLMERLTPFFEKHLSEESGE